ncbi:MAG: hypothetical protein ACRDJF_00485, partial [Actinomycetota bacterium]
EEGFAEPEAPSASEGRSGGPGDDRRGDGRRPLPSKEALSRRKASGKLVYWWETDQGNAGAAREHGRAGGSPAPKPKSARPAEGPRDSSQPAPKVSEDVSATPAERAQPPEITIRLVPAPKRRTKPASKRPKAKPAAKAPTSTPQALSKLSSSSAAPPPAIEGEAGTPLPAIIEDAATSAAPATEASRAGVTGKPVPAVRTRPTIATGPATKLRTTAKTTSPGKRGAATGGRPAPQNRPESPAKAEPDPRADSADDSKAPMTSPPEERPFKYLG